MERGGHACGEARQKPGADIRGGQSFGPYVAPSNEQALSNTNNALCGPAGLVD